MFVTIILDGWQPGKLFINIGDMDRVQTATKIKALAWHNKHALALNLNIKTEL
jgi:hypothetical protein